MPECWRCGRTRPTCELRQTSRGFLCKERAPRELGTYSRCCLIESDRASGAGTSADKLISSSAVQGAPTRV
jgi:hypothetical protein